MSMPIYSMASRTPSIADTAIASPKAAVPSAQVQFSRIRPHKSTRDQSRRRRIFGDRRLDILVLNAGVMLYSSIEGDDCTWQSHTGWRGMGSSCRGVMELATPLSYSRFSLSPPAHRLLEMRTSASSPSRARGTAPRRARLSDFKELHQACKHPFQERAPAPPRGNGHLLPLRAPQARRDHDQLLPRCVFGSARALDWTPELRLTDAPATGTTPDACTQLYAAAALEVEEKDFKESREPHALRAEHPLALAAPFSNQRSERTKTDSPSAKVPFADIVLSIEHIGATAFINVEEDAVG
ncbi:hypothetical protein B0H14DRAFT_2619508 [Mycena olivaceomarginata]|nr:hypothetical protein B0H14DRAFT_2619508 [Mycena olivaceomarginata]